MLRVSHGRVSSGRDQGAVVAGLGLIDVGAGLLVVGVPAWVVGALLGKGPGALVSSGLGVPVGARVGAGVDVGVEEVGVVDGRGGTVVVVLGTGRIFGVVLFWTTEVFGVAGTLAAGIGRTRK
jgi:hypothetical protein